MSRLCLGNVTCLWEGEDFRRQSFQELLEEWPSCERVCRSLPPSQLFGSKTEKAASFEAMEAFFEEAGS